MGHQAVRGVHRQPHGQAVVIIKDGQPTVIVKQGADPREIAQEGFHLVQAIDPTTRAKVAGSTSR